MHDTRSNTTDKLFTQVYLPHEHMYLIDTLSRAVLQCVYTYLTSRERRSMDRGLWVSVLRILSQTLKGK